MTTDVVGLRFVSEGDQQVINAIQRVDKAQQDLQRTSQALGKAIERGSATQDMAIRAYLALERAGVSYASVLKGVEQNERMAAEAAQYHVNQLLGLDSATKSAKDSAQAMAQALREQEAAAARVAPAINELLRIDAPFRSAAQSAEAFSAELRKQEAATSATARATQEFYQDLLRIDQPYASAEASAAAFAAELRKQDAATAAAARATQEFYQELLKVDQPFRSAEASAQAFVTELRKQETATAAVARATQEFYRDLLKIDQPYRSAAASADVFAEAQQRASASYGQLRAAVDPAYAAQLRMKQAHDVVKQALAQEVITREEAARTLAAYRTQAQQTSAAMQGQAAATMFASRAQNASGMAMQQVGYQVGDFLVQVQSGTNAMVAFGQQATQLVGVLPMMGSFMGLSGTALIGLSAGLGIAIPLVTALGAAWMRTASSQDEAGRSAKDLQDRYESLAQALRAYRLEQEAALRGVLPEQITLEDQIRSVEASVSEYEALVEDLRRRVTSPGFGAAGGIDPSSAIGSMFGLFGGGEEAALADAQQQLEDALSDLDTLYEQLADKQARRFDEEYFARMQQLDLEKEIARAGADSYAVRALRVQQEIDAYNRGIDAQVQALELTNAQGEALKSTNAEALNLAFSTEEATAAAARHLTTQAGLYQAYADSRTEADALSKSLLEAYRAGDDLSRADIGAGVDAAALAAAELARQMGISLSLAQGMVALGSGLAAPGGPDQARENVRNTYSGIAGLREEDIVARITRAARIPSGGRGRRGGGGGGAAREQEDYLKNLLLEAEQKRKLVGLSEEETRRQEILFELKKRELPLNDARIEQIIQTEAQTRLLMEAEEKRQQLMQTVEGHIENAFMSWVDGSASVEDAFKGMLRNIILAIYQQQVAEPAARAVGGLLAKAIPFLFKADGGAFNKGVEFFANGGVVGSPTMFQHSGGLGVMGEAGPEAIMPLKRGSDGKLGVQMQGGGGGDTINVHQYFQLSANGDESVRRIVRQEAPRMAEMAKSAVVDAKRRGGSYGRSF